MDENREGFWNHLFSRVMTRRQFMKESANVATAAALSPHVPRVNVEVERTDKQIGSEKGSLQEVGADILKLESKKLQPFEAEHWGPEGDLAPLEMKISQLSSGEYAVATMRRLPAMVAQPGVEPVIMMQRVYAKIDGKLQEVSVSKLVKPELVFAAKGEKAMTAEVKARAGEVAQTDGGPAVVWQYEGQDGKQLETVRLPVVGLGVDAAFSIDGEVTLTKTRTATTEVVSLDENGKMVCTKKAGLVVGNEVANLVLPLESGQMENMLEGCREAEYDRVRVFGVLPGVEVLVPGKADDKGVEYSMADARTVPSLDILNQQLAVPGAAFQIDMKGYWFTDNKTLLTAGNNSWQVLVNDAESVARLDELADKRDVVVRMTRNIEATNAGGTAVKYRLEPTELNILPNIGMKGALSGELPAVEVVDPKIIIRVHDTSEPGMGVKDERIQKSRQANR